MRIFRLVATTLALASATFVFPAMAQQKEKAAVTDERPTVNQLVAYDEARIARLKAEMKLTKEQESAWSKLETTLRDTAKKRAERFIAQLDESDKRDKPLTPADRLRMESAVMAQRAADLKQLADAAEPIFSDKFDERQMRLVSMLIRAHSEMAWREARLDEDGHRRSRGKRQDW